MPQTICPGKDAVPTAQKVGWASGLVWNGVENVTSTGIQYTEYTRCDPKVLRRVVLKEYCALHLAADAVTT